MAFSQNLRNFGYAEGRLTANPVRFQNSDGSVKVKLTLAINDNYRKADGTFGTQMINFEAFVPADTQTGICNLGPYALMETGDKIGLGFSLKTNNYTNANTGEAVYDQVLSINTVDFKETPNEKAARKARKAQAQAVAVAAAANAPAPMATPPEFQVPN